MKRSELMNILSQLKDEEELLCKVFPFCGGPWLGMVKAEVGCNSEVSFNSYGVIGGTCEIKISEIQEVLVLDIKSEEARIFLKLVKKENEAEKIRDEIRKNLGLPVF